jgi:5-oxopent-3-ene-1,2,5-tricarboxylate decarboxylase / 2-hydroxyhepta-2,4-diene-1,7-dioate isomerase
LPTLNHPPYRLSGQVIGALLNHPALWLALGDTVHQAPYKAAPVAPVLSVMPRHMFSGDGGLLAVPSDAPALELGVALGVVIGRTACRVSVQDVLDPAAGFVAAYVVLGEVSLALTSHYRPALRQRARDGFCPIGPQATPAALVPNPDALVTRLLVDGAAVATGSTGERVRGVAQLLAEVSDFMTLQAGDLLSLGRAHPSTRVCVGQTVEFQIDGLASITQRLVAAQGAT